MTVYEGTLSDPEVRLAIVAGRFNELITERLLSGALSALRRLGIQEEAVDVVWVPGSFELPVVAKRLACSGRYDALICLGAIIRGATPHFDVVAGQAASGLASVALETGIPTIFGVLTTDTIEQAIERAGTKAGNKGYEAALSAVEMAQLLHKLPGSRD